MTDLLFIVTCGSARTARNPVPSGWWRQRSPKPSTTQPPPPIPPRNRPNERMTLNSAVSISKVLEIKHIFFANNNGIIKIGKQAGLSRATLKISDQFSSNFPLLYALI